MTSPPQVTATTQQLYQRLPSAFRDQDYSEGRPPGGDQPLLRYLALMFDQADQLATLYDRFAYVQPSDGGPTTGPGSTSDLVNPATADFGWLPWLSQLLGVRWNPVWSPPVARQILGNPQAQWQAGTRQAIINTVQPLLTGSQYVGVFDHYQGDPWKIEVRTRESETVGRTTLEWVDVDGLSDWQHIQALGSWAGITPASVSIPNALVAGGAKPAGYTIIATFYAATWAADMAAYPTWAGWAGAGSWMVIEETGAP